MTGAVGRRARIAPLVLVALSLFGCAVAPAPAGPGVMVLPPPGKPLDLFRAEDYSCRQWASSQIGMSPQDVANQSTAGGAAVGTFMGAAVGAALGSASGHAAEGAVIGAGSGMLLGASAGAESGAAYAGDAQRRYDIAYQQCMYANGNVIPGMPPRTRRSAPPPAPGYAPPPPPGRGPYPPPPPP